MNNLKFNALMRQVSTRCRIDPQKAKAVPTEVRQEAMQHIVRRRQPLVTCLLPDEPDEQWLNAMGYMYQTTSPRTGLTFRHTCEHFIQ